MFPRLKIVKTNTKYIQLVAIRLHLHKLYRLLSLAYGWHLLLASRLPSLADDSDNLRQDVVKHNNNDGNDGMIDGFDGSDADAVDDVAVSDAFDDVTGRRLVLVSSVLLLLQSVHVRSTINGNSTVFSRSMPISSSIFNSVQICGIFEFYSFLLLLSDCFQFRFRLRLRFLLRVFVLWLSWMYLFIGIGCEFGLSAWDTQTYNTIILYCIFTCV